MWRRLRRREARRLGRRRALFARARLPREGQRAGLTRHIALSRRSLPIESPRPRGACRARRQVGAVSPGLLPAVILITDPAWAPDRIDEVIRRAGARLGARLVVQA